MKKLLLTLTILVLCCFTFGLLACSEVTPVEEDKPWYGTYVGKTTYIISKDKMIDQDGVEYIFSVQGNKLCLGEDNTPALNFEKDFNVMSIGLKQNFYYGNISAIDGFISTRVMITKDEIFNLLPDGTFLWQNSENPSNGQRGTYRLRNGVLELKGRNVISNAPLQTAYHMIVNEGYGLEWYVWVRNPDEFFADNNQIIDEPSSPSTPTDQEQQAHTHTFEDEWSYNEAYHYKLPTCEHIDILGEKAEHDFRGTNTCFICNYSKNTTKEITLSFDTTGYDFTFDNLKVTYGEAYDNLPTKAGYTVKWYFDSEKQNQVIPTDIVDITTDTTLYCVATVDLEYTLNNDGESYTVTGIKNSQKTDIAIFDNYNGKPVTEIEEFLFSYNHTITSIVIGNNVKNLVDSSFEGCTSLQEVVIGDGVKSIKANTFKGCNNLQKVTIGNGVTSIVDRLFYEFRSLKSVIIPNGVTSIGEYAFYNCSNLTSIEIPDSVTSIGYEAFYKCSNLTSIKIPYGVTSIGNRAFYYCSNLTSIEIPDSVTSIGYEAFYNCSSLTSIEIPDSVTSISSSSFDGCDKLIKIEKGIKYIDKWVVGCISTSITKPTIKDGTVGICDSVFYNCSSISSIMVPNSVKSIGDSAFYGCSSLTSIIIPNGVTSIGNRAFSNCSSLTSIEIPNSVTSIGNYTFYGCSSLTSIIIPNSVKSIGNYTFYGCSSLTSIEIPNSVTSIGNEAFYNCSSLTSMEIPNGVTNIGDSAFSDCSSLTSVIIPNGVTNIDNYAFYKCSSLTSVVMGDSVTRIGNNAFCDCSSLTSITYQGTKEEWYNVIKDYFWNYNTGNYIIHCSNGDINK